MTCARASGRSCWPWHGNGQPKAAGPCYPRVLANQDASPSLIAAAADLIRDCGALAAHEEKILTHTQAGISALGTIPLEALDEAGRTDLLALSQALTARNA